MFVDDLLDQLCKSISGIYFCASSMHADDLVQTAKSKVAQSGRLICLRLEL